MMWEGQPHSKTYMGKHYDVGRPAPHKDIILLANNMMWESQPYSKTYMGKNYDVGKPAPHKDIYGQTL